MFLAFYIFKIKGIKPQGKPKTRSLYSQLKRGKPRGIYPVLSALARERKTSFFFPRSLDNKYFS